MNSTDECVLRYAAFTDAGKGGNPAGVVLDARRLSEARMLAIAGELGYSETAFLSPRPNGSPRRSYDVRYYSPEAEVPFCGHATIAAAVALAEREGPGDVVFTTRSGDVPVRTLRKPDGSITATLTSVTPAVSEISTEDVEGLVALLGWDIDQLDSALPPRLSYAGARHIILAARTRARLAELDYDYAGLKAYMLARDLTTVDLVWRHDQLTFYARNPFPVGGVVEDPATGAAAAAFGAYLQTLGVVVPPARVTILQGQDMGCPSRLLIDIDPERSEIQVTGTAGPIGNLPPARAPRARLQGEPRIEGA
jgi:PhzF family phenazine biosynthesis protein